MAKILVYLSIWIRRHMSWLRQGNAFSTQKSEILDMIRYDGRPCLSNWGMINILLLFFKPPLTQGTPNGWGWSKKISQQSKIFLLIVTLIQRTITSTWPNHFFNSLDITMKWEHALIWCEKVVFGCTQIASPLNIYWQNIFC